MYGSHHAMKISSESTTWHQRFAPALGRLVLCAIAFAIVAFAGPAAAQTHPRLAKGKYPVKVESAPPGATVYIDRKELGAVGVTPWETKLLNGNYLIILELDGYQVAQKSIKVARTRKQQAT